MKQRYTLRLILILILIAAAVWVVLPTNPGIHIGSIDRDIKVVRGLDLQGGLRILLEADLPEDTEVTSDQMSTVRNIVENRVNGLGVTEPIVQVAGSRRILVELPGIGNPEEAVDTLKETGLLEFVEMTSSDFAYFDGNQILITDFGRPVPTQTLVIEESETPTSTEAENTPIISSTATESTPDADTTPAISATETIVTTPSPSPTPKVFHTVLTGAQLENAYVTQNPNTNEIVVAIEFSEEGGQIFSDYTSTHVGDVLGIVLDKRLISAPFINEPITEGSALISGNFTYENANSLAIQLRYGALPVPLKVVESKTVGPTLGQDSLDKSTIAGVIGLGVVMTFMALYYRLPGVVADLALLVYATITFALFKVIPVTLTLPGIAGFVLSLGVAVDANVLIFERMKEELRAGRRLYQAIDLGFSRAWPSIRDSNLSTLITCGILYWFGSTFGASIVKGFSVTLALGVLVSLFTAITVTRTFLHLVLDNIRLTEHPRWFGV
ncbi:MAG TPA: protein translocase subunit SecD [Anaerolineae bacterium]|nr:protein translocase subunit SecD [Anaerolineae bacterium]